MLQEDANVLEQTLAGAGRWGDLLSTDTARAAEALSLWRSQISIAFWAFKSWQYKQSRRTQNDSQWALCRSERKFDLKPARSVSRYHLTSPPERLSPHPTAARSALALWQQLSIQVFHNITPNCTLPVHFRMMFHNITPKP